MYVVSRNHIIGIRDPTLPIHYDHDDKGQFILSIPIVKRFLHALNHVVTCKAVSKAAQITTYLESPTPLCLTI